MGQQEVTSEPAADSPWSLQHLAQSCASNVFEAYFAWARKRHGTTDKDHASFEIELDKLLKKPHLTDEEQRKVADYKSAENMFDELVGIMWETFKTHLCLTEVVDGCYRPTEEDDEVRLWMKNAGAAYAEAAVKATRGKLSKHAAKHNAARVEQNHGHAKGSRPYPSQHLAWLRNCTLINHKWGFLIDWQQVETDFCRKLGRAMDSRGDGALRPRLSCWPEGVESGPDDSLFRMYWEMVGSGDGEGKGKRRLEVTEVEAENGGERSRVRRKVDAGQGEAGPSTRH